MIHRFWILGLLLFSFCLPVEANELLSYNTYSLKSFGRVQLFVPKDHSQGRVYIKTRFKKPIVKAIAKVDEEKLIPAVGTVQTSSIPTELAQRFGSNFFDVICFPQTVLQTAKHSIAFGLESDNGKETRVVLRGKKLSKVQENLR